METEQLCLASIQGFLPSSSRLGNLTAHRFIFS